MANHWKLTLIVVSIALGLGSILVLLASRRQSQRQESAMALIRDMDRIDQRLAQASREFEIALGQCLASPGAPPHAEGGLELGEVATGELGAGSARAPTAAAGAARGDQPGDRLPDRDALGAVQHAHRALMESVSHSIAVVSSLPAPESESAEIFISSQRKFLLIQRGIIREDFGQLMRMLEDTALPPAARLAAIRTIVEAAYEKTEGEFAAVAAARSRFADEFAIHLTTHP